MTGTKPLLSYSSLCIGKLNNKQVSGTVWLQVLKLGQTILGRKTAQKIIGKNSNNLLSFAAM